MGLLLSVLVGFFMSPFLVHSLGDSMYGIWILLLSVTGYMGLLDTGLKTSIVRYVSRFNAMSDRENLDRVLSTSFVLYSVLSVVAIAITALLAAQFENLFTVDPETIDTIRMVVYLGGIGVAITLPISVFGGLLVGFQRYDQLNKANILLLLLRSIAIVAVLTLGFGIVAVSGIQLASQVLLGGLLAWFAYRQYPSLRINPTAFRQDTAKMLYSYSGFMLLNNLAMYSLFYSGEILIGIFLGSASITHYAIATGLVHYLSKFVGAMTQVLHPYASDQEARGNTEKIKQIVVQGTKWCLLLVLPVALTYIILGRTFISLWMGPQYAELSGAILIIAAIGRIMWLSQSGTGNILLGVGKHKVITSANIATGIASVALSALLVKPFGIVGVALGTSLALSVSQIFIVIYVCKTFRIPGAHYVRAAWGGPLLASLPFCAGLYMIASYATPTHLIAFFAEVLLAVPLFVVPAYFVCFTASERQEYFHRYLRWTTVTVRGA
jgi:O-antigen/teichoic acid export membrane protein